MLNGNTDDMGWNWRHNMGLVLMHRNLAEAYPNLTVSSEFLQNVALHGCSPVFAQYAAQGYDLIVGTSQEYETCVRQAAVAYPNTVFLVISGYTSGLPNYAIGYLRLYQPLFLAGYTAGLMTTSGVVCVVGPMRLPANYQEVGAWVLGVHRARPSVKVHVVWMNSWLDSPAEVWMTAQLHGMGCDVIYIHQNDVSGYRLAAQLGMLSTGSISDYRMIVGESMLVSAYFNWGVLYTTVARLVLNRTFAASSRNFWLGWELDAVALSDYSFVVPTTVVKAVSAIAAQVMPTNVSGDTVFCGPIRATNGTLVCPAGTCVSDEQLQQMDWLPDAAVDHGVWVLPGRFCEAGQYAIWSLSSLTMTCNLCPAGSVPFNQDANSYCVPCPTATYSEPGFPTCLPCPAGSFSENNGTAACLPCSAGTFAAHTGA
eukprot:RCo019777